MYKFLIIAYENKLDGEMGILQNATEIHLVADNSAEALTEAKKIYMAKQYWIKRIEKVNPIELKEMENIMKMINESSIPKKEEGI